ncbi:hypothetical protein D6T64_12150 [Cryobacterium melibiosiphilum]|uniref:Uncharacterized protein n=1 Tax=Cryobacterium melibiosiphilum TaxID=995039 RepID=A0A3A5MGZ4_9MICO|nr:hypothetical protein [Cryobacterium melibiosiphilum]RJT88131.1 hypothetical protein D6T64_12150 [Cryobacterium melibiosiphilum]
MGNADVVARKLEAIPTISTMTARYDSTNADGTVNVDFGAGLVTVYSAGFSTPLPGAGVRVLRLNGFTLMLGVVKPQPSYGEVIATGTPNITVRLTNGVELSLAYLNSYLNPAIGDVVLISWEGHGMVIGSPTAIPEPPVEYVPPNDAAPSPASSAREFVAVDSGNFYTGGGWNYTDPWSSASNTGAFFHNDIAGSIPDSAAISLVEFYVTETYNQHPNVLAKVGLHSLTGKSGNPNIRNSVDISAGTGWKVLPNSFGDALKTGAALGLGFPTVPGGVSYHKFRGRGSGPDGMIRITFSS